MLEDILYNVIRRDVGRMVDGHVQWRYVIRLNVDSVIYRAHFPGHAVTPGVCIVQIAVELAQQALGRAVAVAELQSVKFLNMLTPEEGQEVECQLDIATEGDGLRVKSIIKNTAVTFAKMQMILR